MVVPEAAREAVIKILHDAHPGITRMKSLARGVVWWPGIDKTWKLNLQLAVYAKLTRNHHLLFSCIRGNGLHDHGPDYM